MEFPCIDCREDIGQRVSWQTADGTRPLCHACWKRRASVEEKLERFDRDAKAQLERDLRRADPPRETPDPRRDDPSRETPDPRRRESDMAGPKTCEICFEVCGRPQYQVGPVGPVCSACFQKNAPVELKLQAFDEAARRQAEENVESYAKVYGGRAAEVAKKRCAPSPFVEDAVEAGAVMGLEDAVAAAAKTMATHRQAMAEREAEIQRRMALAGDGTDDPYTMLARERGAADFVRPASFGVEQEAASDPVQRPDHYNQGSIECLDAMVAAFGEDAVRTYARINAFKYLWRSEYKGGDEDLRKAVFYLRRARGEDPR